MARVVEHHPVMGNRRIDLVVEHQVGVEIDQELHELREEQGQPLGPGVERGGQGRPAAFFVALSFLEPWPITTSRGVDEQAVP